MSTPSAAASYNHVFIVMFENTNYSSVIGNPSAPYFNSLANSYGLATQYYGNTHPSIGNYFELTTGQVLTNDDSWTPAANPISADNIVRRLIAGGKTWKSYQENLPSVGYLGGDSGLYYAHHNPIAYLTDAQTSAQRNNIVPFESSTVGFAHDLYAGTLPSYSFITPNSCNSAHDCSLSTADSWLQTNIGPLIGSMTNSLVIVAFDESANDNTHGGGRIYATLIGRQNGVLMTQPHQSTTLYQHQSVLRESLEALGLAYDVGDAATAPSMAEFFPPVGPLAWYSFDAGTINGSIVNDVSGNGLNGTLIGSPASVPGAIGQALQFDGSTTAVSLPLSSLFNRVGQSNAISFGGFIKATASSGTECFICKSDDSTGQYQLYTRPNGHIGAIVGGVESEGSTNVRDGTLRHIFVTVPASSTGLKLYVDGVLETFSLGSGGIGNTSNNVSPKIGARDTAGGGLLRIWHGMIDEPRTYPRELSQAEVKALSDGRATTGTTTMLLGLFGGNECESDPNCRRFHAWFGSYPYFTENNTYTAPSGGSYPNTQDMGYPFVGSYDVLPTDPYTKCGKDPAQQDPYTDFSAAARGDYNSAAQSVVSSHLLGGPGVMIALRIDHEWPGNWYCHSPWIYPYNEQNPSVGPAVWAAGVVQTINAIKALPGMANVKIILDGPTDDIQVTYMTPELMALVDLVGFDVYFDNRWDGADALTGWNSHLGQLSYLSSFAVAHNKPMFAGEWCDTYDGSNITRLAAWMKANNVVGHVYWDTDLNIGAVNGCRLKGLDSRMAAYLAAFGGTTYQGSYWPQPLPALPAGNPMDY